LSFYEERDMKAWLWVIKHAALDAWDAKRALALRSARVAAALAVAAALGLASWGSRDMFRLGSTIEQDREATLLARVANCERELSGLPQQSRINESGINGSGIFWGNPPHRSSRVGFTCRKDRDGEWVERRGLSDPLARLAREGDLAPGFQRWHKLDELPWRYFKPQFSLRAWAESLGLAPLTQASRGLAASTDARQADFFDWACRAFFGLTQAFIMAASTLFFYFPEFFFLLSAFGVGWLAWKAAASFPPLSNGLAKRAICSIAVGAASAWALAQAGVATLAMVAMIFPDQDLNFALKHAHANYARVDQAAPLVRFEPLADCGERLDNARVTRIRQRGFACRKEGDATLLVSFTTPSWSDDAAREDAQNIFGLQTSRLSPGRTMIREPSWSAFLELAGWNEPTARNRDWAASTPRFGDSAAGVIGWKYRAFVGTGLLLSMVGLIAILASWAKPIPQQCVLLARRFKEKGEALASSSEFVARAQRRELDKHAPKPNERSKARQTRL
jgi:hypothetical protein